jgi:hypothetical protein
MELRGAVSRNGIFLRLSPTGIPKLVMHLGHLHGVGKMGQARISNRANAYPFYLLVFLWHLRFSVLPWRSPSSVHPFMSCSSPCRPHSSSLDPAAMSSPWSLPPRARWIPPPRAHPGPCLLPSPSNLGTSSTQGRTTTWWHGSRHGSHQAIGASHHSRRIASPVMRTQFCISSLLTTLFASPTGSNVGVDCLML